MGKVWHYCVVVMDICFFSGLASLGYTGGGNVYVNDSARAAGERTLSLNTLAIAAFFMLLYNSFLSF